MFRNVKKIVLMCVCIAMIPLIIIIRYSQPSRSVIVDFLSPFLSKKEDAKANLRHRTSFKESKAELLRRNEDLLKHLESVSSGLRDITILRDENRELRKLLHLEGRIEFDHISAKIISRDPASSRRKYRVNKGKKAGVKLGQAVLAGGYLFGRIFEVSEHTALVLSLLDPNCKVSVRIANTNLHGILFGMSTQLWKQDPLCIIRYLPRDRNYHAGMKVETSAIGAMIPPGIQIGTLKRDRNGNVMETVDNLFKTANLKPGGLSEDVNFLIIVTQIIDAKSQSNR